MDTIDKMIAEFRIRKKADAFELKSLLHRRQDRVDERRERRAEKRRAMEQRREAKIKARAETKRIERTERAERRRAREARLVEKATSRAKREAKREFAAIAKAKVQRLPTKRDRGAIRRRNVEERKPRPLPPLPY